MELQEFIKETLVQITNAVSEAQEDLKESGCLINPEGYTTDGGQIKQGYKNEYRSIQKIKMHVAISVNEDKGSSSKLGVAKILNAGIDSKESSSNQQVTTIDFDIPIALPVMDNKD